MDIQQAFVISIRKYLSSGVPAKTDALTSASLKMSGDLLEGIALHAVNYDPVDCDTFQTRFRTLRHEYAESRSPSSFPAITTAALHAMESFNHGVGKNTRAHLREMQAIVGMLTRALVQETDCSEASAFHLQSITEQLEKVYQIDDVRVVKIRLAETLHTLQQETSRQTAAAARLGTALKKAGAEPVMKSLMQKLECEEDRKAEMALWSGLADPADNFAVVFCVDRLDAIRARFGSEGSDQVLLSCRNQISEKLLAGAQLFRCKDAAFVTVIERFEAAETVRSEVKRLASPLTIAVGQRQVAITVALCWAVLPLPEFSSLEALIDKVDSFLSGVLPSPALLSAERNEAAERHHA